jgi:predicted NUDIX family NTP pyrophosphohydrolase
MMPKRSAGLIMYRWQDGQSEVFLVHPGGPFWAKKDRGAWIIPKGECKDNEEPLETAKREFREETGFVADGQFLKLGTIRQSGGKIVTVWAFESDCDPAQLVSNCFQLEWPPHSGQLSEFPEVDRGAWLSILAARGQILKSQAPFLDMLCTALQASKASS